MERHLNKSKYGCPANRFGSPGSAGPASPAPPQVEAAVILKYIIKSMYTTDLLHIFIENNFGNIKKAAKQVLQHFPLIKDSC